MKKESKTLVGIYDKLLQVLDEETEKIPEILSAVSPERRLDFISKTVPLLLKYRESAEGNTYAQIWGD